MSNVPSGTRVIGPNGEILIYTINQAAGWMTLWNSTQVERQTKINQYGPTGSKHGSWLTAYMGTTLDGSLGIMWNKTIPTGLPGSVWATYNDEMIVGNQLYGSWMVLGEDTPVFWALSLTSGEEGRLLYNKTWTKPTGDIAMIRAAVSIDSKVFTLRAKETREVYGFNLETGTQIWGPTEEMDIRSVYGATAYIAYDKLLFTADFAGIVYCYDVQTGELLWTYEVRDPYGTSEMWHKEFGGDMWPITPLFITDGKIYIGQSEHSPENPLPRGAPFICLDVETGEEVFRVDGMFRQTRWGGRAIIGDSIIATQDTYNQQVYAIGKGPSRTTVAAPDVGVQLGGSLIISGSVTDVSPGTEEYAIAARFPNGVPAMSDASQSDWMLYVYKQFTKPMDAVGVDVDLSVVDANGNFRSIGSATTDVSGKYSLQWTPDIPGKYTVFATFAGSGAFFGSSDQSAFCVDSAPDATVAPTPEPAKVSEMYFVPAIAGLFVLIIVVAIVMVVLLLRKRP